MDWRTERPWSLEEEAEWKAELEQRQQGGVVEELMDDAVEDDLGTSPDVIDTPKVESAESNIPEKYLVTA